jgi:hypothetical protein
VPEIGITKLGAFHAPFAKGGPVAMAVFSSESGRSSLRSAAYGRFPRRMICLDTTALGEERASGRDTQPIADLLTGPIEVLPFEFPAEAPKASRGEKWLREKSSQLESDWPK